MIVTRPPARHNSSALRAATDPSPTTTQARPCRRIMMGKTRTSVDIARVAPFGGEALQLELGLGLRQPAVLHDDRLQSAMDIASHAVCIVADVEVCAVADPAPLLLAELQHPVLHVDLLRPVAGEGGLKPRQRGVLEETFEL